MTMTESEHHLLQTAKELQFATFYVGEQLMGVDIRQVQEINRQVETTPVPHTPEFVRGVVNLRGDVVTVLDLRTVLGLGTTELGHDTRCVVLEVDGAKTGLLVDRIADVVATRAADMEPPPANVAGADARFFSGVWKLADELLVVLAVGTVLNKQFGREGSAAATAVAGLVATA
jgi:purine-binding chemotaxis protein CheW